MLRACIGMGVDRGVFPLVFIHDNTNVFLFCEIIPIVSPSLLVLCCAG